MRKFLGNPSSDYSKYEISLNAFSPQFGTLILIRDVQLLLNKKSYAIQWTHLFGAKSCKYVSRSPPCKNSRTIIYYSKKELNSVFHIYTENIVG